MNPPTQTEPPTSARRVARVVALAGVLSVAGLASPALAGAIQRPTDAVPDRVARAVDAAPTDARPGDHKPEILRLGCNVRQTDPPTDVRSAVVCRWSAPTSGHAVGVRLLRIAVGSGQGREVIYRSSNLEVTEHIDTAVRPGHRYVYAVQALNSNGRIVGSSRAVTVGVPPVDTPPVEVLKIACAAAEVDSPSDRVRVGCEWSLPRADGARVLTLWRSVDGAARQRVASFTHPFESSYRDVVPAGTYRVSYAVIATNGAGEVVARSRATTVAIPNTPRVTDVVADVASDVAPDVISDVAPDPVSDVAPGAVGDVAPDPVSDVAPDPATDLAPVATDVPADVVVDPAATVVDTRPDVPERDEPERDEPERDEPARDVPVRDRPERDVRGDARPDVVTDTATSASREQAD